ncbi:hypothetical protein IKG33_03300 [Candidatus Saccharibacteria bacterium]|nr:hypothetical protein [Candidatus Saccharibacteria bacterium]
MNPSYDNGFGGFSSGGIASGGGAMPINSGTGDIVLNSGASKEKSKKWLVIGCIAVVLIIAIVLMLLSTFKGNGTEDELNISVKEAFNKYGNYLLYGNDSTEEIVKDDDLDIYSTEFFFDSMDSEQLTILKNHYDEYYRDHELFDNNEMYEYNETFEFYYNYLKDGEISIDDIAALYDGHSNSTQEKINHMIDAYIEKTPEMIKYKELKKRQTELLLKKVSYYSENGCLDDGIDYKCIVDLPSPLTSDESNELNILDRKIEDIIIKERFILVNSTFWMSTNMEVELKDEDEE